MRNARAHCWLKRLFFTVLVRPAVLVVLGLNVRRRALLPTVGPAIIAANHNSHLDTLVLMSLLAPSALARARPVAAADYFLRNRWLAFFTTKVLDVLPIERGATRGEPDHDILAACEAALRQGDILIVFPEGTRGAPEQLEPIKSGVARLLARVPETTLVPVFMHGLGKTLPKGAWLPVPFTCDVLVGLPLTWRGDRIAFIRQLRSAFADLANEGQFPAWE